MNDSLYSMEEEKEGRWKECCLDAIEKEEKTSANATACLIYCRKGEQRWSAEYSSSWKGCDVLWYSW